MEEHARRVQHRAQKRASAAFDPCGCVAHDIVEVDRSAAGDRRPRRVEGFAGGVDQQRVGKPGERGSDPVDRGKGAPWVHRPTYNTEVKVRVKSRREPWG